MALGTCGAEQDACSEALHDSWSMLGGLPVTLHAAAFYLVLAGLAAASLAGSSLLRSLARALLLLTAGAGVLITVTFAARALLWLGVLCRYCLFLYLVSLGALLAAMLQNPAGLRGALAALRRRAREAAFVTFVAALAGLSAFMAQRALFLQAARGAADSEPHPCVVQLREVEATPLVLHHSPQPQVLVALFIDLGCAHCRDEFAFWREHAASLAARGVALDVNVYNFPRASCSREDVIRGGADTSSSRSCDAARALSCIASRDPEQGAAAISRLFELRDGFDSAALAAVAREFGWDADPARTPAQDPFFACMRSPETQALLRRHMRFAEDVAQLERPPGLLIIPLREGRPVGAARQFHGRKEASVYDEQIIKLASGVTP